jgi:hypothetical protein
MARAKAHVEAPSILDGNDRRPLSYSSSAPLLRGYVGAPLVRWGARRKAVPRSHTTGTSGRPIRARVQRSKRAYHAPRPTHG